MKSKRWVIGTILMLSSFGHSQVKPLTQKEACRRFMPAVVRIDVADGNATGFIVSPDGWIVTAAHVVFDPKTGELRTTIDVTLPGGGPSEFAQVFVDREAIIRDFALLKVEKDNLPFLEIGDETQVSPGSEVAIIGHPFSAMGPYSPSITTKFCMAAMVTATDSITHEQVKISAVYFQGPAVKGISGAPIIALDSGQVVGVQSAKLAAISNALDETRTRLIESKGRVQIQVAGINFADSVLALINDLDRHLANGLGSATGAADVALALSRAKRQYQRQKRPATHF